LRALASLAVPTIVTVHYFPDVGSMGLIAHMMRAATWVVGVSAAVLSTVRALMPEIASRSSILYNGLALPERLPSAVVFDPPQLLCIGRLVPEKGFDVALHALAVMRRTRPDVRMVVAGDGPERPALIAKASGLGLTDIVTFTGWVHPDSVPALIDASTMVLVPSRWEEPFGLVAVQAGQMARPTVASRVGGLPEIVVEGRTGLFVTKENPEQLAAAVLSLLDDPIGAQRMGEAARAHVQLHFGLERFVDEYEMLYRQVGRA
jgi:glycogen(starch) synthase